jgi:hypothetical protein
MSARNAFTHTIIRITAADLRITNIQQKNARLGTFKIRFNPYNKLDVRQACSATNVMDGTS